MIAISPLRLKKKLEAHVLHGHLSLKDFNNLHLAVAAGRRKVILATSIAESDMSIDDVTCVIDCGLVRDKEIDCVLISPHRMQWKSKASAHRRSSLVRRLLTTSTSS